MPVSTSKPAPGQLVPPAVLPMLMPPSSFDSGPVGGTYGVGSQRNSDRFFERLRAQRRREVDEVALGDVGARVGRRLGHERLRRRRLLVLHRRLRHRPLFDRPDRHAGDAVEAVEPALLARARRRSCASCRRPWCRSAAAPTTCRGPTAGGARTGSATCARRSSGRPRPAIRRTGCRRDGCRRTRRWSAFRSAGRRCPASGSTVICVHTPLLPV